MTKVLANDGISQSGIDTLEAAGFEVITQKVAQEQLANVINEKDINVLLVRSATTARKELIDACPNLKLIGRGGVGMDNIDVEYAKDKGLEVINTPAASSESVAELVFAHLFNLVRFVYDSNRQMPLEGDTKFKDLKKAYAKGSELKGKKLGIIGFGRIGQAVAKRAHFGFDMDIQYWDPYDIPDDVTKKFNATKLDTIEDVCRECDFVSINCPATKETFHLMNDERFKLMKKSAFIINTARGDIIDEKALVNALVNKEIAGAALDVFETEPNLPNELKTMENVVSFPHLGSATSETRIAMGNTAIDNTLAFFAGTELPNKVV